MKRRLSNIATVASLVLFVTTAAIWVRSYLIGDHLSWLRDQAGTNSWLRRIYEIRSSRGGLMFRYICSASTDPFSVEAFRADAEIQPRFSHAGYPADRYPVIYPRAASPWRRFGFGYDARYSGFGVPPTVWIQQIVLPYWLPALLCAVLPVLWYLRIRTARRRVRLNQCPTCGYDLRATPERCPECGAVANAKANT